MAGRAILGVILAGGRSTRMGAEKAFMPVEGAPLIARVAGRFAPQVARLVINANGAAARFAALGLEVIDDCGSSQPGFEGQGPLAGIAAVLAYARGAGFSRVATVPVDAPFLPLDLVARLAAGEQDEVAVAAASGGMEPLFAIWPLEFEPVVAAALADGERAVHRLVRRLPHRLFDFAGDENAPSLFLNLNTPEDAAAFERGKEQ